MRSLLLTSFGLGLMRPASGTWGSTPPPLLVLGLLALGAGQVVVNTSLVVMGLVFSIACVAFGRYAESKWGKKDPGQVVADEVAGQSIALLALPWSYDFLQDAVMAASAFLAFRIFDILKPPPANQLQRLPAGWGILVDDLFAGVYALVVVQVLWRAVL